MSKLLVHIYSHPQMKNNVTMGLLVAVTGLREGHDVEIFFSADGVHLLNCKNENEIVGQGTGDVKVHLDELREPNLPILCVVHNFDQLVHFLQGWVKVSANSSITVLTDWG